MAVIVQSGATNTVVVDRARTAAVTAQVVEAMRATDARQVIVVEDEQRSVSVGSPGPQGVPGAPGSGTLAQIAAVDIGGHRVVRSAGAGTVSYASNSEPLHGDDTIGMSANAAMAGQEVTVVMSGALAFNGWAWTPGKPVYLAADGLLTQTPDMDTAAFAQTIGHASDPQTVFVAVEPPIYF